MKLVQTRPAETGGAASAIALLVAYLLGVRDPGVITALGVVIGFIPAAITWLVNLTRRPAGQSGYALVELVFAILLAALVYWICVALGLPVVVGVIAAVLVLLSGAGWAGRW